MPPYFAQSHHYACSLAALRSVLAAKGLEVSEEKLLGEVEKDYGKNFKNLWNPTIAKLACEYGIVTRVYALWPLLKPEVFRASSQEFKRDPEHLDIRKYENPNVIHREGEPLPLAYKEMFKAVEKGCQVTYGGLTKHRVEHILGQGHLIQTSIQLKKLYPDQRDSFHSILLYNYRDGQITYHDPARRAAIESSVEKIIKAAEGTGAFMEFIV